MPTDELLEHAKSDTDFYALLGEGVHPGSSEKDISRAYRRTALKHHPDKNKDDPNAVAKFHALQIAHDVLSDPAAKAAHDAARAAREARKQRTADLDDRRRTLIENLEKGERAAFKRKRDETDAEDALEREVQRLAEDGRRRRKEMEEKLRRRAADEVAKSEQVAEPEPKAEASVGGASSVTDLHRAVKVRWSMDGPGRDVNKESLTKLFCHFGKIDAVVIKEPKKKKKKPTATGLIVFKSVFGANSAVNGMEQQEGLEWKVFEDIEWAEGKEPDFGNGTRGSKNGA